MSKPNFKKTLFSSLFVFLLALLGSQMIWKPLGSDSKFQPTVLGRVDFDIARNVIQGEHTNHHNGSYALVLVAEKPVSIGQSYTLTDLNVVVAFYQDEEKLLEKKIASYEYEYWSNSSEGVSLFRYEVPKDLPIKVPLNVVVEVEEKSLKALQRYQMNKVMVSKRSDK